MKVTNRRFTEIINGNKQFVIPIFQRDYSWTEQQCHQMWDDILRAGRNDGGHFLGSIVYVEANAADAVFQDWLVIDGQQRLASLTLLLTALRDHITETGWSGTEDSPNVDRINDYFIKNNLETGDRNYKLMLRRSDNLTLRNLVDGKAPGDGCSELIVEAYECFKDHLRDPQCDLDSVYRGVNRLNVVDVVLERPSDNPQLVFESMNSTGVDLSQSDLVRNYLLMGLNEAEQTGLYDEYWRGIEDLFKISSEAFDSFLRDYIALRKRFTQPMRLDRVYEEFKIFWRPDGKKSLENLLQDIARFARPYASFRGLASGQPEWLAGAMRNMRKLGTTPGLLVMRLYDNHERNLLSQEEFIRAVALIESYILRRDVVGLSARNYWSVFARVARDSELRFESFRVAVALLQGNNRFPNDEEFRRILEERDLYGLKSCKHILDRLENAGQREPSPVHNYSIEHIMPQGITEIDEWKRMLGGDWQKIHHEWVHRLGNLTLTAYNSRYSNRPFEDKKAMEGGFGQSAVRLNEHVRNQDKWTAAQMSERSKRLAEHALKIWPYHEVDQAAIRQADIRELRARADERTPDSLEMNDDVRRLIGAVRQTVYELDDIIEIVEHKSVCCYGPEFFAELLPMKYYVRVILPLDFDEVEIPDGLDVHDASSWKFVPNRVHIDCDLLVNIRQENEVTKVMPMIRQAFHRQGL